MAIIKKLLHSNPHSSTIKIKTDTGGGEIEVGLDELCYRSEPKTNNFNTDEKNKFADCVEGVSEAVPVCAIWGGHTQEGHIRVYRGQKDLEHLLFSACVGDTCQYDMQGETIHGDNEYPTEKFIFEIESEVTFWMRVHKTKFNVHYETGSYGIYDDIEQHGALIK